MDLSSVGTTIRGLISGIGKPPGAYIGHRAAQLAIYLVKDRIQGVFIGHDDHLGSFNGHGKQKFVWNWALYRTYTR